MLATSYCISTVLNWTIKSSKTYQTIYWWAGTSLFDLLLPEVFRISSTLAENYTLQYISYYTTLPTWRLNTCPLHQWYMPMWWRNWHSVLFDWMDIGRDMLHYLWRKNYFVRWPLNYNFPIIYSHMSLSFSLHINLIGTRYYPSFFFLQHWSYRSYLPWPPRDWC